MEQNPKEETQKVENKEENNNKNKENQEKDKKDDDYFDLENQPKYGYWKREGDLINRDQYIPKPVEKEKLEEVIKNNESLQKQVSGSAWNAAGTWEEKHYKKHQIEDYFNKNLENKALPEGIILKSISNYSGDVRF